MSPAVLQLVLSLLELAIKEAPEFIKDIEALLGKGQTDPAPPPLAPIVDATTAPILDRLKKESE